MFLAQSRRWMAPRMKLSHYFTSQPKGLTLMELMATLGVAAILMAIAIPNFMSTLPGPATQRRSSPSGDRPATDPDEGDRTEPSLSNHFSTTTYVLQKCSGSSCTTSANDSGNIVLPTRDHHY